MLCLAATPMRAEMQRADIERIIKDYLDAHPAASSGSSKTILPENPDAVSAALRRAHQATDEERQLLREKRRGTAEDLAAIQENARQLCRNRRIN